jgi:hypothetical protein
MRGVLMTASAQLGNRLVAARREKAISGVARPVRLAAPTRPRPVPPAPIPPAAPLVSGRPTAAPAPRPALIRRACEAEETHPPVWSRRVVSLIVAVTLTLAVVGGLSWLGQTADPGIPERTTVIRVGAGETVWDVAARVAPRSNQRAVVERIRQLNSMVGAAVRPDQQLLVPDGR